MSSDGDNALTQVKPGKPYPATAVTKAKHPDKTALGTCKMRLTIKNKLTAGFGILLVLFVAFGAVVLMNMANVQDQFTYVIEYDAPVIANANRLLKLIVDMETGQRGFCITQKEEFLEPYNLAHDAFYALLKTEKELVKDHRDQVEALERIKELIDRWHETAAKPEIAMARKVSTHVVDAQHLQDVLRRGTGKELMDRFMALGHEIEVSFSGRGDWEGAFVVEIIEKCMSDREAGQRGFLITGQEAFLEKFNAGEQKKLPAYFARLRAIVGNKGLEDELSEGIDQLEQLAREWTLKAAEPEIAARRQMNDHPESLKDVAALLEAGTGKALVDKTREELAEFIQLVEGLAAQRYATAFATTRKTRSITLWLVIFSVAFGSSVAVWSIRAILHAIGIVLEGTKIVGTGDLGHRIEIDSQDEIGQLAIAFNQMTEKMSVTQGKLVESSKMASLGRMAAGIAHELNQPMGAVLLNSQSIGVCLERGRLDLVQELCDKNVQQVRRASSIMNALRQFSREDQEVDRVPCDLNELVENMVLLVENDFKLKGVRLEKQLRPNLPPLRAVPVHIEQIISNILLNARDALEGCDDKTVQIGTYEDHGTVVLEIGDSGGGISQENQSKIFDPFYTTKGVGKGTGLGLSLSYAMVKSNGGTISVESEVGVGTVFRIAFHSHEEVFA